MAKQDSRDLEIEEEWEEYSGIIKGSVKAILQDLHESCGIIDRDEDADKNLSSQQLDGLMENVNNLSEETSRDAKYLASVASRTFPENFIQDTQASSDLMSSSDSSKVGLLCLDCSNRSDDTQNLASVGLNLSESTHEKQNGQKETYCAECKKTIHSAETILDPTESETPGMYRVAIEKILREMSDRESNGRKELEMMNYQSREFVKKTDTLRNDINRRREELKELVDRHADTLLVEVDSWRDEVSQIQGAEIKTLSRYVDSLDSYKASCKEILVDGSLIDIEKVAADLEKKARELRKIPEDGFHGLFHAFRVSLKKTKIEEFLTDYYNNNNNNNNIVGVLEEDSDIQDFEQISEEKKIYSVDRYDFPKRRSRLEKFRKGSTQRDQNGDRIVYRDEPVLVGTLKTNAAEKEDRGILGVAFLDDELFVISRERSEVEVFDCRRFIFSCELDIDCLLNPEDIGSCTNRKCLYIMDRKRDRSRSEILRVDTDGKLMRRWSTGGQWGRISVTPESNILLCMYKTQMLNEYTPDGVLLRVIQFAPETGLDHPRHALKLASGQFLVGHGETGDAVHRVVKIDARGKVVGSFFGSSVTSDEEIMMMRRPFYLASDADAQSVFVADTDNRRVLMLNSALELNRELLSGDRHGLRYPARICIDSSRGLLFVADNKVGDKRILVFLIK